MRHKAGSVEVDGQRFGAVADCWRRGAGGVPPVERLCRADPNLITRPAHLALALPWIFVLGAAAQDGAGCAPVGLAVPGGGLFGLRLDHAQPARR
jgi:hypothetical protein